MASPTSSSRSTPEPSAPELEMTPIRKKVKMVQIHDDYSTEDENEPTRYPTVRPATGTQKRPFLLENLYQFMCW